MLSGGGAEGHRGAPLAGSILNDVTPLRGQLVPRGTNLYGPARPRGTHLAAFSSVETTRLAGRLLSAADVMSRTEVFIAGPGDLGAHKESCELTGSRAERLGG
jgi:hypothetical protein